MDTQTKSMKPNRSLFRCYSFAVLSAMVLLGFILAPLRATANEWWLEGDSVFAILDVGYSQDASQFSGTVAVRMDPVTVSGQFKLVTTILSVTPQPGFAYVIKKNGGVNGPVEIVFASATCDSKFSFLYKPGLTKIDFGVLRCR